MTTAVRFHEVCIMFGGRARARAGTRRWQAKTAPRFRPPRGRCWVCNDCTLEVEEGEILSPDGPCFAGSRGKSDA